MIYAVIRSTDSTTRFTFSEVVGLVLSCSFVFMLCNLTLTLRKCLPEHPSTRASVY
jgi:predicted benzoate:H+ symporter BenE